jgi:hypothetical protein
MTKIKSRPNKLKPFELRKFFQTERAREIALAQRELDALKGWKPSSEVRAYRKMRAAHHMRRADVFLSAIRNLD